MSEAQTNVRPVGITVWAFILIASLAATLTGLIAYYGTIVPFEKQLLVRDIQSISDEIENVIAARSTIITTAAGHVRIDNILENKNLENFLGILREKIPDFTSLEIINDRGQVVAMIGEVPLAQAGVISPTLSSKYIRVTTDINPNRGLFLDDPENGCFLITCKHIDPDKGHWFSRTRFYRDALDKILTTPPGRSASLIPLSGAKGLANSSIRNRKEQNFISIFGNWWNGPYRAEAALGTSGWLVRVDTVYKTSVLSYGQVWIPLFIFILTSSVPIIRAAVYRVRRMEVKKPATKPQETVTSFDFHQKESGELIKQASALGIEKPLAAVACGAVAAAALSSTTCAPPSKTEPKEIIPESNFDHVRTETPLPKSSLDKFGECESSSHAVKSQLLDFNNIIVSKMDLIEDEPNTAIADRPITEDLTEINPAEHSLSLADKAGTCEIDEPGFILTKEAIATSDSVESHLLSIIGGFGPSEALSPGFDWLAGLEEVFGQQEEDSDYPEKTTIKTIESLQASPSIKLLRSEKDPYESEEFFVEGDADLSRSHERSGKSDQVEEMKDQMLFGEPETQPEIFNIQDGAVSLANFSDDILGPTNAGQESDSDYFSIEPDALSGPKTISVELEIPDDYFASPITEEISEVEEALGSPELQHHEIQEEIFDSKIEKQEFAQEKSYSDLPEFLDICWMEPAETPSEEHKKTSPEVFNIVAECSEEHANKKEIPESLEVSWEEPDGSQSKDTGKTSGPQKYTWT